MTSTVPATKKIITGEDYINSLRSRDLTIYVFGEKVEILDRQEGWIYLKLLFDGKIAA